MTCKCTWNQETRTVTDLCSAHGTVLRGYVQDEREHLRALMQKRCDYLAEQAQRELGGTAAIAALGLAQLIRALPGKG